MAEYLNSIPLPMVAVGAVALVVGILIGYLIALRSRHRLEKEFIALDARMKSEQAVSEERLVVLKQSEERLTAAVNRVANESMTRNSENFLRLARENLGTHQERASATLKEREKAVEALVKPLRDSLERAQKQISELEKARQEAFGSIKHQLEAMTSDQRALTTETRNLVNALRRPQVRGRWGELTLRRIAELAGMVEHCDFTEQTHVAGDDGAIRPDMVVRLPERGELIVDVKTPLDAYIEAMEAGTDEMRNAALTRHARNVADRVRELASKSYWSQFERSPEFVILFIPGDQFLSAALSENPTLLEDALRQKVVLATPTSLVALLKAVAYGWQQLALADNAEEIKTLAEDLYDRLGTFTGHLARLGRQLDSSVNAFNQAVGSMERMVLPGARKFVELGVRERKKHDTPGQIDRNARVLVENRSEKDSDEPPTPDETE